MVYYSIILQVSEIFARVSVSNKFFLQVRGDDYGEFINLEDFDVSGLKDENKENIDLQIPYDDDDMMGEEELAIMLPLELLWFVLFLLNPLSFSIPYLAVILWSC